MCGTAYASGLVTACNGHVIGSAVAMGFVGSVVVCICYGSSHGTTVPVLVLAWIIQQCNVVVPFMLLVLRQCDGHGTACDHEIVTAFIGLVAVSIHHFSTRTQINRMAKVSPQETSATLSLKLSYATKTWIP